MNSKMGVSEPLREWRVTHFAFVSDLRVDALEHSFERGSACVRPTYPQVEPKRP
jgi:hypothetical protein